MKQRIILISAGAVLFILLFAFGKTAVEKPVHAHEESSVPQLNIQEVLQGQKEKLSPSQQIYVSELENQVTRGDVKSGRAAAYGALAEFYRDSAQALIPYIYYLSEQAKLENSLETLTFAAHFVLENMRREPQPPVKVWEAKTAAALFEQALKLDPDDDDLKVGLGSCYVFGEGMIGDPAQTMKGVQYLLEVARRDSNNMKAQMVLGIGAVISNQLDKAIERLQKVVDHDSHNLEAVSWLADAYATHGDTEEAIKWYEHSKHLVNNPAYSKEVDERIRELKKTGQ